MTNPSETAVPFKGPWQEQKTKLLAKYDTLTSEDLTYEKGKKDEMLDKVQVKLGKTKEELAEIIAAL